MLDYFVESHGGVKGDEQYHVAIRVDRGPTCCDVGAVPGRSVAMCVDPQGYISNGCEFRQCKSGKNRLIFSEESEQVACVSVHSKLVTRATHFGAYRCWRGGVKSNMSRGVQSLVSPTDAENNTSRLLRVAVVHLNPLNN
ncbi:MAG: hypothetical protein CME33_09120 [Gimesia sp.]|uniref:hypothetical protein n=1 Tax=Gimesia sp. TaxID=2024833 RepID=UPI000C47785A|nr:hypothetical protein [Gimesia sp.]MAX36714.1 hypothetical protein [Gimesia sp.]